MAAVSPRHPQIRQTPPQLKAKTEAFSQIKPAKINLSLFGRLGLEGVAVGGEGLHGCDGAVEELGKLPAQHLGALRNHVA